MKQRYNIDKNFRQKSIDYSLKRYKENEEVRIAQNERGKRRYANDKNFRENRLNYGKQWRKKMASHLKKYFHEYGKTEKRKEQNFRNKLKRRTQGAKYNFTLKERMYFLKRDKWICQRCKIKVHDDRTKPYTNNKAHIHHIIPVSKGGNNDPNNLQVLCRKCNCELGNKIEVQLSLFMGKSI